MSLNVDLTFSDSDVTGLRVRQYVFEDALNGVFELRVDVLTADADLDLGKIIGHPVTVTLKDEPFVGKVHGIVRGVRQVSAEPDGDSKYEIAVVPPLWLASRGADHRIFQETTADEACAQLLALYTGRIPAPGVLAAPGRPKREYRVQYGEVDLEFVLRALAEEGLVAYFNFAEGSTDWTLTETTAFTDSDAPKVPFVPPTGTGGQVSGAQVSAIMLSAGIETTAVTVRDYDFKKPPFVLEKNAETSQEPFAREDPLERYEYLSGKFTAATEKQGQALAKQYLEEARGERRLLECRTNFVLGAGGRFTVEHHPRGDVNGQLLVVRARCSVAEDDAGKLVKHNTLVCIPAADPWRPRRRAKPRIHGTHLAFVVGQQAGVDEIDVDEHGRVKVEFRWDRRDLHEGKPTRYVRVSQGWAGLDYGFVMLPRVNEEVIVAYLDGDPDEPVIVGRLHNAFNTSPLKLPDQKTQSMWKSKTSPGGGGYNEIMMEDKKGQELLRVHAHRDNLVTVGGSQTVDVGGNQKIHVKGTRDDHVEGAVTEAWDTSLTTTIGGPQSTKAEAVTEEYASLDTTVKGVHHEKFGSIGMEGGNVNWNVGEVGWLTGGLIWHLKGPARISAPSVIIDTPDFQVTNAGGHKEVKGFWDTVHAAWNDTTSHKVAFLTSDTKFVTIEAKVHDVSINVGTLKMETLAVKIEKNGIIWSRKNINLEQQSARLSQIGTSLLTAGLYVIN